jgi:hypothetical protein
LEDNLLEEERMLVEEEEDERMLVEEVDDEEFLEELEDNLLEEERMLVEDDDMSQCCGTMAIKRSKYF